MWQPHLQFSEGNCPIICPFVFKAEMGHYFMALKASKAMDTGFWYQKYFFIPIPSSPYFCFIFISPCSIFLSLLKYLLSSESFNAILIQLYIKNTSEYFKILEKITIKLTVQLSQTFVLRRYPLRNTYS